MNPQLQDTQEDIEILFRLHDIRREERFIKAQGWFKVECSLSWVEEARDMIAPSSPAYKPELGLLVSYMETAASLINRDVPNVELFAGPVSEMLLLWCRMEKYVDYVRNDLNLPQFLVNVERVARSMPEKVERVRRLDEADLRSQLVQRAKAYLEIAWMRSHEERKAMLRDYEAVCLHTLLSIAGICNLELAARHVAENKLRGSYVECGVWRGGSVAYWARSFLRNGGDPTATNIFAFDAFQGMPRMTAVDGEIASQLLYNKRSGDIAESLTDGALIPPNPSTASETECRAVIEASGFPKRQIHVVKGWFQDTLAAHKEQIAPIAVLRLDSDFYDATRVCLSSLYDSVMANGMVIIDDYELFPGCRQAVNEHAATIGLKTPLIYYGEYGRFFVKR
jgi:O-methyltransferase